VFDVAVIGGGIVGLATGYVLSERFPDARVAVLEKEAAPARHQSGRNSGVIHSGIYYRPGSLKARLARAGNRAMVAFCEQHGVPFERTGKVIVATRPAELLLLEALYGRGLQNGLCVRKLRGEEVREVEPHVRAVAGIYVSSTGTADYGAVCRTYAALLTGAGNELRLGCKVLGIRETAHGYALETTTGALETRFLVNCAGLHSDRVARLGGARPEAKIVPFRGEYYELRPERRGLVKGLIYPVPNPNFPFLGVHFTRDVHGHVHAGPNAVLSFKREGYRKRDVSFRDTAETLLYGGFWRLVAKHAGDGLQETLRSWSKAAFVRSLQRLVPEVEASDLRPAPAGVRAQALRPDGGLVDDFSIVQQPRAIHVLNAPSPAATASLEIAKAIVQRIPLLPHISAPYTHRLYTRGEP